MTGAFQPRNEAELGDTLRGCAAEGRRVRLSGGGLVAKKGEGELLGVWMFGISGVVEIREGDLVATARAGTSLFEIAAELQERGRRFPLRPYDAGDRATVGGVFAAAADGLSGRLGFRARDVLLGARAVLAGGAVVAVGAKVVKSVAGFDVCKALVGSRGCLAAITEVTFRIEAIPEVSTTLTGVFDDRAAAHAALAAAGSIALQPSALVASPQEDGVRVDVLLEGPRAAVAEAARLLASKGLAAGEGDWATLTAFAALDPRTSLALAVSPSPRAAPLDALPPGAELYLIDVLRGRSYVHVPPASVKKRETPPLLERVRQAFDPKGTLAPGRGIGST